MKLRSLRHSLVARLIGISLLLLLAVQLAGFVVVRASIERNARAQITRELDTDVRVWRRLLEQKAERLRQGSALLAADYGFRSAVTSDDMATIESALANHGARIGAAVTALLDTQLALRVVSGEAGMAQLPAALVQVVPALAAEPAGSQIAVINGLPHQFVMVPLRAPLVIGWVLMGFPVGQPLADEMRQLLSADVAVRVGDGKGGFSVPVSTLAPQALAQLRAGGAQVNELRLEGGDTLLVRASPLSQVGVPSEALLLRSVDAVVAPYRQLQWLLAVITVAGVLLFALGSSAMARRVTTPLRSLLAATRRLSRGDYSVPMEHTARSDEVGDLARSIDHMRIDIGRQQAEIRNLAYRDRLTGLPNRERFRAAVLDALRADPLPGHSLAVLMLDLDRFKHVNDVLGYAFGDRLLQAVAGRLQPMAGTPGDMVAARRQRICPAAACGGRAGRAARGRAHSARVRDLHPVR